MAHLYRYIQIKDKTIDSTIPHNKPFCPFLHENEYCEEYNKYEREGYKSLKELRDSLIENKIEEDGIIGGEGKRLNTQDNGINSQTAIHIPEVVTLNSEDKIIPEESIPIKDYDPKADLIRYQYPSFELFNSYGSEADFAQDQLLNDQDRVVSVLNNFGIDVVDVEASPGPSFTFYKITLKNPAKNRRVNSFKDDISITITGRTGTRIIAPIPGTNLLGIEVPNEELKQFGLRYCLNTESYRNTNNHLPIIVGKNDLFTPICIDLTKSPHILIAGGSGQGKSTWLNSAILSLICANHPSTLKLVLIDTKRIEFGLYERIGNHFLARRCDRENSVESDEVKALDLLYSVQAEMEDRFSLLKDAGCRHVIEYNQMFVTRKLSPQKHIISDTGSMEGTHHRYLPYLVVVIDEYSGIAQKNKKTFEPTLIALAQKAHNVGIHLIIATNQLSNDIITSGIKQYFPTRLAFKVLTNKDSKLIIDQEEAQSLIGCGDLILFQDNSLTRLQGAYSDTIEINKVCTYISEQQGYPTPLILPDLKSPNDVTGSNKAPANITNLNQLDPLIEAAAELIVATGQGSTSMIQRKFAIGYTRAGIIMDQLESVGIVGPYIGSKSRSVLIDSDQELNNILQDLRRRGVF